jgi:hypothetical protein
MQGPPNDIGCNDIFSPPVANLFRPTTTAVPSSSDHFILVRRNSPSVQSSLSSDGRIIPVKFNGNNSKKDGHVVGASGYNSMEHYTLLLLMESTPDSFHSTESYPEWKALYDKMLVDYYNKYNMTPRESMALQKHFVEFYSAFKNGVCALSLQPGSPTLPTECTDEDYLNDYVQALLKILFNTPKVLKK